MKTVLIDENVILNLAQRTDIDVPCMKMAHISYATQPQAGGCKCAQRAAHVRPVVLNAEHVKVCITQLPQEKIATLKNILGADSLIVYINIPGLARRAVL